MTPAPDPTRPFYQLNDPEHPAPRDGTWIELQYYIVGCAKAQWRQGAWRDRDGDVFKARIPTHWRPILDAEAGGETYYIIDGEKVVCNDYPDNTTTASLIRSRLPESRKSYILYKELDTKGPDQLVVEDTKISLLPPPTFYTIPFASFASPPPAPSATPRTVEQKLIEEHEELERVEANPPELRFRDGLLWRTRAILAERELTAALTRAKQAEGERDRFKSMYLAEWTENEALLAKAGIDFTPDEDGGKPVSEAIGEIVAQRDDLQRQLAEAKAKLETITRERDRLRDVKWEGISKLEAQLAEVTRERDEAEASIDEILGDMPNPSAARREAGITCHHLPRLTIGSENGYICAECWAIEEQSKNTALSARLTAVLAAGNATVEHFRYQQACTCGSCPSCDLLAAWTAATGQSGS